MFLKRKENQPAGPVEWAIVGLGNPGTKYENTRHNIGFLAVDLIAQELGVKINKLQFSSLCGRAVIDGHKVLLMKPSTFMNRSGQAVRDMMRFYKLPIENVLVLADDVALNAGQGRIRRSGSDGGHNGLKDIIYQTGSDQFPRVKLGVGQKPHPEMDLADWVLGKIPKQDSEKVMLMLEKTYDAVKLIVNGEIDKAMNQYNQSI